MLCTKAMITLLKPTFMPTELPNLGVLIFRAIHRQTPGSTESCCITCSHDGRLQPWLQTTRGYCSSPETLILPGTCAPFGEILGRFPLQINSSLSMRNSPHPKPPQQPKLKELTNTGLLQGHSPAHVHTPGKCCQKLTPTSLVVSSIVYLCTSEASLLPRVLPRCTIWYFLLFSWAVGKPLAPRTCQSAEQ